MRIDRRGERVRKERKRRVKINDKLNCRLRKIQMILWPFPLVKCSSSKLSQIHNSLKNINAQHVSITCAVSYVAMTTLMLQHDAKILQSLRDLMQYLT